MKTFLLFFWLGGAVALWISFSVLLAEAVFRWERDFAEVKLSKHSRATYINAMLKWLIISLIPGVNWLMTYVCTFQFDELATKIVLAVREEAIDDLQTDDGTHYENRSGV